MPARSSTMVMQPSPDRAQCPNGEAMQKRDAAEELRNRKKRAELTSRQTRKYEASSSSRPTTSGNGEKAYQKIREKAPSTAPHQKTLSRSHKEVVSRKDSLSGRVSAHTPHIPDMAQRGMPLRTSSDHSQARKPVRKTSKSNTPPPRRSIQSMQTSNSWRSEERPSRAVRDDDQSRKSKADQNWKEEKPTSWKSEEMRPSKASVRDNDQSRKSKVDQSWKGERPTRSNSRDDDTSRKSKVDRSSDRSQAVQKRRERAVDPASNNSLSKDRKPFIAERERSNSMPRRAVISGNDERLQQKRSGRTPRSTSMGFGPATDEIPAVKPTRAKRSTSMVHGPVSGERSTVKPGRAERSASMVFGPVSGERSTVKPTRRATRSTSLGFGPSSGERSASRPESSINIPSNIGSTYTCYVEKMNDRSSSSGLRRHRSFDAAVNLSENFGLGRIDESFQKRSSSEDRSRSRQKRAPVKNSGRSLRSAEGTMAVRRRLSADRSPRQTMSEGRSIRTDSSHKAKENSTTRPHSRSTRGSIVSYQRDRVNKDDTTATPFSQAISAIMVNNQSLISGATSTKDMEERIAALLLEQLRNDVSKPVGDETLQNSQTSTNGPPKDFATIVLTDIQGSTSLWEANPAVMQDAVDIHDKIMRRQCAFHNGYEIDTEGDAFFLAFHNPMDAFGFALGTQSCLYDTEWSKDLLSMKPAMEEGCFRGLRVRMSIHSGKVRTTTNEVTGRTEYAGETMQVAKCLENMTHGGQILTTFETWNVASYKAEADLGSPQVLDLGSYFMHLKGSDCTIDQRIIQLVPASLSFDYFAARRSIIDGKEHSQEPSGRRFPSPTANQKHGASFHDAPYVNNDVTIGFVYFSEIESRYEHATEITASLIRLVGELLVGTTGYQSQSNMLAFPSVNVAVQFGLRLLEEVKKLTLTDDLADLSQLMKFGCVHDTFLTMGPHKTTGRADYFGKVVNRAARITAKGDLGTVNFGVLEDQEASNFPEVSTSIVCERKGANQLKGVQEYMVLYECRRGHL